MNHVLVMFFDGTLRMRMEGDPMGDRRGRPRSEESRRAILAAAGQLMLEGGLGAASIEAIAARARVSKATIYKWWPSRGAVALEGFLERVQHSITIPEGLDTVAALRVPGGRADKALP